MMNEKVVYMCLCLMPVLPIYGDGGWTAKCVGRRQDKVFLNCPEGHVVYQPRIFLGTSTTSTCRFQDGDCKGLTSRLEKDVQSCFWKKWCKLRWRKQPMMIVENATCFRQMPTYVMFKNPTCVNEGEIVNICENKHALSPLPKGIIRSSRKYPMNYEDVERPCTKTLRHRPGHTLVLTIDDLGTAGNDSLYIHIRDAHSDMKKDLLRSNSITKEKSFELNEGDAHITFNAAASMNAARGFVIRFEYKKNETANRVKYKERADVGKSVPGDTSITGEDFSVRGTVDTCISGRRDSLSIVCPSGHVIFQPDVTTGVSNGGRCMSQAGDCHGMTHTLVTQRNMCYWKDRCELSWNRDVPITVTQTLSCLALYPKYLSLKGYDCVPKDQVFDICEEEAIINSTSGIIKSHSNYPWFYPRTPLTCRKYIPVDSNFGLRIYTLKMDLDPDAKGDNLRFSESNSKILATVRARDHVDIIRKDGCLMIEFRVSKRSKGGAGFVLKFHSVGHSAGVMPRELSSAACIDYVRATKQDKQLPADSAHVSTENDNRKSSRKPSDRRRKGRKKNRQRSNFQNTSIQRTQSNDVAAYSQSYRRNGRRRTRKRGWGRKRKTSGKRRRKKGRGRKRGRRKYSKSSQSLSITGLWSDK